MKRNGVLKVPEACGHGQFAASGMSFLRYAFWAEN